MQQNIPRLPNRSRFIVGSDRARGWAALALLMAFTGQTRAQDAGSSLRHPGDDVLITLHAVGTQYYQCAASASGGLDWTFKAPEADLSSKGEVLAHHSAGPTWAYRDGSRIVGKVVAKASSQDPGQDIPWLRLDVISHAGAGVLDQADTVLRVNTKGGNLQGACQAPGTERKVPYEADYVFIRRPKAL